MNNTDPRILEIVRVILADKRKVIPVSVPHDYRVATFAAALRRHLPDQYAKLGKEGRVIWVRVNP